MGKRVLCFACKKPIHISKLGGVMKVKNGKETWFHNNIGCLVKLYFINLKGEI